MIAGEEPLGTRLIVPTERHVERLSREGFACETRASLMRRLLEALAPEVILASPEVTRLVLTDALTAVGPDDPLLGPIARSGERIWLKTVDSIDAAIATLRAADTPRGALDRVEALGGTSGRRARMLRTALAALDRALEAMGLVDGRSAGAVLARAISKVDLAQLVDAVGSVRLRARWIVTWEPLDLAWWRVLDSSLARAGGGAVLELPTFASRLDAAKQRDPLEVLFDEVARGLDGAPDTFPIEPWLGDLRQAETAPHPERVEVRQAADAEVQARAVADAVHAELARGTPIEEIAIALPRLDERALEPLRRVFDDLGIPLHDPRGPAPATAAIVAHALAAHALGSRGLPRQDVARLLRSRYVDATALSASGSPSPLLRLAALLERTPTAQGEGSVGQLEATARAGVSKGRRAGTDADKADDEVARAMSALARRIGEILAATAHTRTRLEHVRAARALWTALGFPARVGVDARATLARDDVPVGLGRAELHALARDAHAWGVLTQALDRYEAAVIATGSSAIITADAFRHELERTLEAGEPPPGARRIGALRVARVADFAYEPLACLIIASANEGELPVRDAHPVLIFESFAAALREVDPVRAPAPSSLTASRSLGALALAAARAKKIIFVYSTHDAEGALQEPAPLVSWLVRSGAEERKWPLTALRSRPLTPREERLSLLAKGPERAREILPDAARRAHIELARESFHGARASELRGEVTGLLPRIDAVARALTEETGGAGRPLPVTSLERFARCAFQGFAAHVLGAREKEDAAEIPDPRQSGTLVHEALAAAFTATMPLWRERPRDAEGIRALAMEAADRVLAPGRTASPLRRMALEQTRDDVRKVIDFSLADEAYDFELAERAFGDPREGKPEDGAWPALRIAAEDFAVAIRGTIDRVDRSHDAEAVRIIDYKRGARTAREAQRDVTRLAFQLPLYAHIAQQVMGARRADGIYLPTRQLSKSDRSFGAYGKEWAEAMGDGEAGVKTRTMAIVRALREGVLLPLPTDDRVCDRCAYDGACRRPRFVASEEDEAAPRGEGPR